MITITIEKGLATARLTYPFSTPPRLTFSIDGHLHDRLSAFAIRPAPQSTAQRQWQASTPLPQTLYDGAPHIIRVSIESWEDPAPKAEAIHAEQLFQWGNCHGKVTATRNNLTGWVAFTERPTIPQTLTVRTENDPFGRGYPLLVLPEENRFVAHFDIPAHGEDKIIHVYCGCHELKGSPIIRPQKLIGQLQRADGDILQGWIVDHNNPRAPLELILSIDGEILDRFRPNHKREDIAREFKWKDGQAGLLGFQFKLPGCVRDGKPHQVSISVAGSNYVLNDCPKTIQAPPSVITYNEKQAKNTPAGKARLPRPFAPEVSVIILNRNGAKLLEALFQSWQQHNSHPNQEFIVVDHASEDESLPMLRRWQTVFPIRIIALDFNDSFSNSCNRAARLARGQHLLFLNNDIVWLQDALPQMLGSLKEAGTGIVGIKLLKSNNAEQTNDRAMVQHLGVRFKLDGSAYWPYETTPSPSENEFAPQPVPAVTAAVMLCRKQEFLDAGLFDKSYFYGFEDVEFCIRFTQKLGKKIICRNDLVALHRHGHTRLSGRAMEIYQKVIDNGPILQSHIGLWLKQAYWSALLHSESNLTTERLAIGIVIDAPDQEGNTGPLEKKARRLAKHIRSRHPHAAIYLLPPQLGWYPLPEIHLLIIGHPDYDLRRIQRARADLITIAWPQGSAKSWQDKPWWGDFDKYLAPTKNTHAWLQTAHGLSNGPSTEEKPLGDLLDQLEENIRIELLIEDGQSGQSATTAENYRKQIRQQGATCWIRKETSPHPPRLALIRIAITNDSASFTTNNIAQAGTLNLLFSPGTKTRGHNKGWQHISKLPNYNSLRELLKKNK